MNQKNNDLAKDFRKEILHESISAIKLNTYSDNYDLIMNDLYGEDRSSFFDVNV
jgi:hypothetical protein